MRLPSAKVWKEWYRYPLAILTIAVAAVLQSGLSRLVGDPVPFMLLHPALVLIAVYCGRGPALLALLLSAIHTAVSLEAFASSASATSAQYSVLIYVAVGLMIVLVTSALRRAAQRAQEAELRLRIVQDDAGVGLWEMDLNAGTILASRSMWQLLGLNGVDRPVPVREWERHLLPEEVQSSLDSMRAQMAAGVKSYEHEFRARMANGEIRHFLARINIEYGETGAAVRLRAAVVDVTGRKQWETEQRRHMDELREVDRRRTEFLATLAHELRNPLAPIRHATSLAQSPQASSAQVRWALEIIDRQIGHMARLLEDLLEASRISRGALELRREPVELAAIMAVAIETAKPLLESKGHTLNDRIPSTPIYLHADPVRLAQVFSNLLTNAAKYTHSPGKIDIEVELIEDQVALRVRDNGIGIAPEILPRLFELFAQADSALEHAQGGLGIGLALVKGLVHLHGGTVDARSAGLGQGSEFTVRLPRMEAPANVAGDTVGDAARIQPCRILVADDNSDAADSLSALLELDGHEVHVAYNGADAMQLCARARPDVAFLDIGMPELDGYELARRIRAQSWAEGMKLVAITGWGQSDDRQRALDAGFDVHLTKPVTPQSLAAILSAGQSRIAAA